MDAERENTYNARIAQLNQPSNGHCGMCNTLTTERNLTRIFERINMLDICPECCNILGIDSIADWPDGMMCFRWDRAPWRPQDYR